MPVHEAMVLFGFPHHILMEVGGIYLFSNHHGIVIENDFFFLELKKIITLKLVHFSREHKDLE